MAVRILRIRDVCHRTGMSRSSIYAYELRGEFPKRIQISTRAVGWVEQEVESWIKARIAASC